MIVLAGKLLICMAGWMLTVLAIRSRWLAAADDRSFARWFVIAVLVTRVGIFAIIYGLLHYEVPSDIPAGYYPPAREALAGHLVYRDFFTTYAPLFPYACALALVVWHSMKSIVFLAIVMEVAGALFWIRFATVSPDRKTRRTAAALYAFNPLLLCAVPIAGQNHVWISPFLAAAALAAVQQRSALSGMLLSLCTLVTKFLAFFFALPLFVIAPKRRAFVVGFTLVTIVGYGAFLAAGANVFTPVIFQRSVGQESSANLPYLLSSIGIPMTSLLYPALAVLCLALLSLFAFMIEADRRRIVTIFSYFTVAVFVIVLLFSKKAFTSYWSAALFPLCWMWAEKMLESGRGMAVFLLWSSAAALEPSLYYRWTSASDLSHAREWISRSPVEALIFFAIQIGLALFSVFLLVRCYRWFRGQYIPGRWGIPVREQAKEFAA